MTRSPIRNGLSTALRIRGEPSQTREYSHHYRSKRESRPEIRKRVSLLIGLTRVALGRYK